MAKKKSDPNLPTAPCGLCHGTGARPGALSSVAFSRNPAPLAGTDVRCPRCEGRGVVNINPPSRQEVLANE